MPSPIDSCAQDSDAPSAERTDWDPTAKVYYRTSELCERFRCSSRTIWRRMKRPINPFPEPKFRTAGSQCLWEVAAVSAWETAERERTKRGDK